MQDVMTYLATTGTRKIHMEMTYQPGHPTCDRSETIAERIAPLADDGGQNGTIATLTEHGIAPSRLCGHCFGHRLIHTYKQRRAAARTQGASTAATRRPYAVIRVFSPADAINHYEQVLATRRCVNRDWIGGQIAATRAECPSETVVSQHATREEAEQDAARRYAAPGELFRAERCDVDAITNFN
jgi:hypothetical protein